MKASVWKWGIAGAGLGLVLCGHSLNGIAQTQTPAAAPTAAHATAVFGKYCAGCHSGSAPKGDVLLKFKDDGEAVAKATDDEFWTKVRTEVASGHMPPANITNRPSDSERQLLVDFIDKDVFGSIKPDPGPFIVHRLNNREYANTVRDLLYLPPDYNASADFPADERGDGFDNNSDTLVLSPVLIEHYLDAAQKAGTEAMKPRKDVEAVKAAQVSLAGSTSRLNDPSKDFKVDYANPMEKVKVNLATFAPRVFRRPVTDADMAALMKFVDMAFTHDGLSDQSIDRAMALAIRAALMSPDFIFRMERDANADGSGKIFALNEWQLASRLSYFLWGTMPDDALFAEAKAGTLRQHLDVQVARMLKDPKAGSLTRDFLGQWLEIRGLDQTPNVPKEMLASMKGETEHFFNYIVTNDRPVTDLLDSDYTFVDARLAKLYGIPGITGDDFRKVAVDHAQRGGVLTQAAILTLTSKPLGTGLRTSPVVRGKYILENIFNRKIPPPPPNVPPLPLDTNTTLTGTVRQILEQHRVNPVCAGCHARMDPYGFAFENYDGTGAWRLQDNHVDVDPSGDIDGLKFTGPVELRKLLVERKDDFRNAFIRKVLSYSLGRSIQGFDRPAVEAISAAVKADGDRFSSVVLNVVRSYPFQNARSSVVTAAGKTEKGKQASLGEPGAAAR